MKKNDLRFLCLVLMSGILLTGCSNEDTPRSNATSNSSAQVEAGNQATASLPFVPELEVRFGREGSPFTMHLYDNDTARAIARYVGTSDWNLPIYHYDDYENYEVMQYYDIPSRYDIPANPEMITSQKAGEVYYSEPNRIVLFYQDANITGEYTRLGYFDATSEFVAAVENNPVVEGWSNKIVSIRPMK